MVHAYDAVLFDLYGTLIGDGGVAIPGASERLETLPPERWAVVTSCSARIARVLFEEAQLPAPPLLVSADDVAAEKPSPEGYLIAAQRMGRAPDRCLVVEDSSHGIEAGRAAGMDVVAILRGRGIGFAGRATFAVGALADLNLRAVAQGLELEI